MSDSPIQDTFRRPLRDLRISVTDRCNFRCTYCMPAEIFHERYQFLPKKEILSFEEMTRLTRIMVSLDSLDETVFQRLNGGRSSVQKVLEGIAAAEKAGLAPIKINAVVQRGVNDHTIVDLARWAKDKGYILRFIEYMDVGNMNGWRMDEVVPAQEIVERIDSAMP